MRCIACQPLPSPSLPQQRHKHQVWQSIKPSSTPVIKFNRINGLPLVTFRNRNCRALPSAIFLAARLTDSTKISVILQTGAVCLFAFWVANFVVPGIILKNLQESDSTNDDSEYSDDED